MNSEYVKEYNRQCKEYKKFLYSKYPETERFEKRKMRFGLFLVCYSLILYLVKAFLLSSSGNLSGYLFFKGLITGFGVNMIFIFAAMGFKWRIACCLYFLAFWQLFTIIQNIRAAGLLSWEWFRYAYIEGFSEYPLQISLDYLTWLMPLLLLIFAVWLTLVPANRRMAEQSEVLNQQFKEYISSHPLQ